MFNKLLFIGLLLVLPSLLFAQGHRGRHHQFTLLPTDPPDQYNDFFAAAGACLFCHNAQIDNAGVSVAIVNDWRSTMMANAARDPFWKAKVSHETLVYPQLKTEIETVCSRCHAPMGNINAFKLGAESYTIAEMNEDPIALDGVSCSVCHQITPESMGNSSGNLLTSDNQTIYGPYSDPFGNPMINNTGYTPEYGAHIKDSRLCASCHTLITNPLDFDGVPTGGEFVEQAPYQEWKNSIYPEAGSSCYTCHVPEIDDIVKVSTMPPWLDGRTPFGKHHFAGANVFMLKMLRNNIDELELTANASQFDSTINRTIANLQLQTMDLNVSQIDRTEDTLSIWVELSNLAGHKLPTAYPSRRMFIELYVISNNTDTIFHSGKLDSDQNIIGENTNYEQHYNHINDPSQAQIYEMVMGDVNGDVTTVLERSAVQLKDNRIPPVGFTTTHLSYDTVLIAGQALTDPDFNKVDEIEGSGKDIIHYQIPLLGSGWDLSITASVYYQTVSNKWLTEMFSHSSSDIDTFKSMYQSSDQMPVLLGSKTIMSVYPYIEDQRIPDILVYPNPSSGEVSIGSSANIEEIETYSLQGKLVSTFSFSEKQKTADFFVSHQTGVYLMIIKTKYDRFVQKVIVQ